MSDPGLSSAAIVFLFVLIATVFAFVLILMGRLVNPTRPNPVKAMPYESGMDPIHGARRRFDVRFHLVAIAFLVFDVELLFLYPWAVLLGESRAARQVASQTAGAQVASLSGEGAGAITSTSKELFAGPGAKPPGAYSKDWARASLPPFAFGAGLIFIVLLALGYVYDWGKGVFRWR
ncbi:MAG: NADH-quinone oxidoreductase subunit A [Thermoguttaceae bacterium]|nr:NADH-quinone oxidoreductase subunit A [Thermoguttaceae bacterium]MDW8079599.1 NADH-quinone oxidoreductase subunit A [Thermoguttaceae bacterium]